VYSETALPHGAVLWSSAGSGGATIPADGCVDLILRGDRVAVAGPSTRFIVTERDGDDGSLGIRLPPGSAGSFLRLGLAEIADQLVDLEDVVGRSRAESLRADLMRVRDDASAIDRIAWLATDAAADNRWSEAVRRRAVRTVAAATAATELGDSERTLRRRMLSTFGYGYATLVRIERARRAQTLLLRGVPIADAAARAGYADQPHLSREFRRLAGVSPAQFAGSAA
jgi:AraC-like DNA-binding protein